MCVHIMRFTNCCKCPVWDFAQDVWCLNMFNRPSLNEQNISLGNLSAHTQLGLWPNTITSCLLKYSEFAKNVIVKVSLEVWKSSEQLSVQVKARKWWLGWNYMSLRLIYLSIYSWEILHAAFAHDWKNGINLRVGWKCPITVLELACSQCIFA